jgi:hypothetical protein
MLRYGFDLHTLCFISHVIVCMLIKQLLQDKPTPTVRAPDFRLFQLVFSDEIVFFSHNKSVNSIFQLAYQHSRTGPLPCAQTWHTTKVLFAVCPTTRTRQTRLCRVPMCGLTAKKFFYLLAFKMFLLCQNNVMYSMTKFDNFLYKFTIFK